MPYINQELRDLVDNELDALLESVGHNVTDDQKDGVINYLITSLVASAFEPRGYGGWKYFQIVRAMGAFECAKSEFYRRIAGPKEDQVILENGDIYYYGR